MIKKSKLQKAKDRALEMYLGWKQVYSPYFQKNIAFTRYGYNHLCVTKWRTGVEQKERLTILPLGKKLLSISHTVQGERYEGKYKYYEFMALMGGVKITVIVSEVIKTKELYFLSVFKN